MLVRLCYSSVEKQHILEGGAGLQKNDLAKARSDLEAERNCFGVRCTALEAELIESHTATDSVVTKLSVFVSKLGRFGA